VGADGLITAELIQQLAASAKLTPLIHPGDAPPEPGYVPSAALADFVRCRDLTCRAPGCDRPAIGCDIDHTIPYANGDATHRSNLKCLCRLHSRLAKIPSEICSPDWPRESKISAAGGPLPVLTRQPCAK
jgi:hypothetical protein